MKVKTEIFEGMGWNDYGFLTWTIHRLGFMTRKERQQLLSRLIVESGMNQYNR